MSQKEVFDEWFAKSLTNIHAYRREALCAGVESLLVGSRLTLTNLGRHLSGPSWIKHKIKRVDRLLGNHQLRQEIPVIYGALTAQLSNHIKHWVILVDVCYLKDHHACQKIRASIALSGRALTLYELCYRKEAMKKSHAQFLEGLSRIVPKSTEIILVCDAGFQATWYRQVESYGWDWVGRIRQGFQQVYYEGAWHGVSSLWCHARRRACGLGEIKLSKTHELGCHLVSYRHPPKGRQKRIGMERFAVAEKARHTVDKPKSPGF